MIDTLHQGETDQSRVCMMFGIRDALIEGTTKGTEPGRDRGESEGCFMRSFTVVIQWIGDRGMR
jgi:hypothetical protein